jgi:hypothetical protein
MSIVRSDATIGLAIQCGDAAVQIQPPVTMAAWARLNVDPADTTIRGVVDFTTPTFSAGLIGYNFFLVSSKFRAYVRLATAPNSWATVAATANATVGKWYHLALRVFDTDPTAGNRIVEFFVDGVSQGTHSTAFDIGDDNPPPDIRYATSNLMLGRYISNLSETAIQDLAIWNVKLTDAEIAYMAGSRSHWAPLAVGQAATLRPFWPFDEMNDEQEVGSSPKDFQNRGKMLTNVSDFFYPGGTDSGSTGHKTRGQSIPTIYGPGARMITVSAPAAAAPSFRGLALCGVGV